MDDYHLSELDYLFSDDSLIIDLNNILFIGRKVIFNEISSILASEYHMQYSENLDVAITNLLQENYAIILLDRDDENLEPISVAESISKSHPISRIIILTSDLLVSSTHNLINSGFIHGLIPYPVADSNLIKLMTEQEANYTINKAVISIVSQPPKLSKASFILLDPTLSFSDETQPLNFVGVFIVHNSVPKFTRFFEKTLAHDELLLAGYLSSISSLGDELYNNKESLREINFCGISVIIRYYNLLQISFLVRNLTRHNESKAEERIDEVVQKLISEHNDHLASHFLTKEQENGLINILDELDYGDILEKEKYQKAQDVQQRKASIEQIILVYSKERQIGQFLSNHIQNQLGSDFICRIVAVENENEVVDYLNKENCCVLILDSKSTNPLETSSNMEYFKEILPSIQILLITQMEKLSNYEIQAFNSDDLDFICEFPDNFETISNFQKVCVKGLEISWNIKKHAEIGSKLEILDPTTVRTMLRESADSYTEEDAPILHGILITKEHEELFEQFWQIDGKKFEVDRGILAGMISSLKNVGGEAFIQKKSIVGLELGGSELFIKHRENFIFLYFVKNVKPNTAVLIEKEVDAVTSLYYEIITEAGALIPFQQLKSIFLQIAYKTKNSFTQLLREKRE